MDETDQLLVSVRADTQAFAADIQAMRGSFDNVLLGGFEQAGRLLERSLLTALRKGSFGFEDLGRIALSVLDRIASQALNIGFDSLFGGGGGAGGGAGGGLGGVLGGLLSSTIGAIFGLPGRATGGPVAPNRPYLVGERGPELFVPTAAGRVEAAMAGGGERRDVRVAINLSSPRGTDAPVALQRSSRQVASAVRRALVQH